MRMENMPVAIPTVFGVEVVRGILRVRGSPPRLRISLTEAAEPWLRPSEEPPPGATVQSWLCGEGIISVGPMVTPFRGGPWGYRAAVGLKWLDRDEGFMLVVELLAASQE